MYVSLYNSSIQATSKTPRYIHGYFWLITGEPGTQPATPAAADPGLSTQGGGDVGVGRRHGR